VTDAMVGTVIYFESMSRRCRRQSNRLVVPQCRLSTRPMRSPRFKCYWQDQGVSVVPAATVTLCSDSLKRRTLLAGMIPLARSPYSSAGRIQTIHSSPGRISFRAFCEAGTKPSIRPR
jgi:hypothetical protein